MKTVNYTLKNTTLESILNPKEFIDKRNILIQIFCGEGKEKLERLTQEVSLLLPYSVCIGTTTDGEIQNHNISTKESIISISTFENVILKNAYVTQKNSFEAGADLCQKLIQKDTKLIILFSDGTSTNGEEFLKGVESVNADVIIAGGMAGDNGDFIQTFISCGREVLSNGAVGVSLNSNTLQVHNSYSFNWDPIGIEHKIDEVVQNRIYSIDGIKPIEFYAKYLGQDVANALPATGIEFPLIIEKNGIKIARAVIAKHDDGSLSFAGNLNEGDSVRLGFGNIETILNKQNTLLDKYSKTSVESFFIYSCMARRRYMPDLIQIEIEPFANIAPTTGFFTYAEFYHHNKHNELLNQTLTAVALSESLDTKNTIQTIRHKTEVENEYATTVKALTHLIQQSSKDLEEKSKKLALEKEFSQNLLDKQKLFLRHAVHETNTPLAVIMSNVELYELEHGKNEYLSNINAAMKNVFTIYDDLGYLVKKNQVSYPKQEIDLVDYLRSRLDFFKELALQSSLEFSFFTNIDTAFIYFSEAKLQRIIDNNLTNAIKYTKKNEKIFLQIKENDKNIIFSIYSKSLEIENATKIFEAYYRENTINSGLGLGLNLVKQICDEENVVIEVTSLEDKTSFSYLFFKGDT